MELRLFAAPRISGTVSIPGDKSISHRAALFGALARGSTTIWNFLRAGDTLGTLQVLDALGVPIRDDGESISIQGVGWDGLRAPSAALDCGNSGTTTRLLLGVLAGCDFEATLSGDASLSRRPMDRVRVPLELMGARVLGQGDRCAPPITIRGGKLRGIEYASPVASAQVKSAVLLAGLRARGRTTVVEPHPSRDHTERMLRGFGVDVEVEGSSASVQGGQQLIATDVEVPGDISSAAFFLVAGALKPGCDVMVRGVGINPSRTGILDVLEEMGARLELIDERESGGEPLADVRAHHGELKGIEIGGALIPRLVDELPVIALLATQARGRTVVRDAAELRVKESDRIAVLVRELSKLGARIEERPDGFEIEGPCDLIGARVASPPGDHRIAMTLAVAGLLASGETVVENADAVSSSFPGFFETLESLRHLSSPRSSPSTTELQKR